MSIDRCNTLVGSWFQQLAGNDLLHGKHDPIFTSDTNRGPSVLYRLDRVFDLEVSSIGREDGIREIVTCTYRSLRRSASIPN